MKIGGKQVTGPPEVFEIFEREGGPLVFRARALPDMEEFYKRCPEPKPPGKLTKDGYIPMTNDPGYLEIMANHVKQRVGYMVTRSLEPSEIEWDTVDLDNPKTWPNWEKDLRDAGMTQVEVNRVGKLVMEANSLDEAKLQAARDSFLLGRVLARSASSSQSTEPASSPSGEPAPVSE